MFARLLMLKDLPYRFFRTVPCHRKPERCYHIKGSPMPICSRCLSILLGYLFIPLIFLLPIDIPFYWGFICQIPMFIDGYTQLKKWRTSNNILRTITGLISGFGMSVLIVKGVKFILLVPLY